jgi:hypothetical protein
MKSRRFERYADWLALAIGLLLLTAYLYNLAGWRVHDDEGEYLYQVWRMTGGEIPYRDFLTPQLPVFLYAGRAAMEVGGPSLWAMRFWNTILAFSVGGLLYVAGRKHASRLVGLLAMVLFLIHPDVYKECRIFRNEPLMLLLVTAGLVIATWPSGNRRRHVALTGLCLGLAGMTKLFGLLPAAGIGLWLLWGWADRRRRFRDFLGDALAFGLPLLLIMAIIGGGFYLGIPDFIDLVLGHHLAQGSELTAGEVVGSKLDLYWEYLGFYPAFLPLALLSAGVGFAKRDDRRKWAWQVPTALAFLALSRGLGRRHFMYLLPTLSLLAAWLLAEGIASRRWWIRLLGAGALLAIALPALDADIYRAQWTDSDTSRIVDIIKEHTGPEDFLLADDIGLGFYARRATTYSGAALSHGAVTSGQITGERLIDEMVTSNTRLVVMDQSLLTGNHMVFLRDYPRYHRFLEANFELLGRFRRDYQELEMWLRPTDRPFVTEDRFEIEHPDGTRFGESMTLIGYSLPAAPLRPGDQLVFTLFWTSEAPADHYWSVFTHLVAQDGAVVAQHDKVPYDGLYPTNRWWPGQVVDDVYAISLPEEASSGEYRLGIGMYDWQTGDRLSLRTADGEPIPDDYLWLAQTVTVVGSN